MWTKKRAKRLKKPTSFCCERKHMLNITSAYMKIINYRVKNATLSLQLSSDVTTAEGAIGACVGTAQRGDANFQSKDSLTRSKFAKNA